MSLEVERVYTINLGKALLSQSQHRAVRAINMIKEFARHHMKVESIKIEEELAHKIWERGVRSPPRKIRVRMSITDEGHVLVSQYDETTELKPVLEQSTSEDLTPVEFPTPKVETESESHEDKSETSKESATELDDKPKDLEPNDDTQLKESTELDDKPKDLEPNDDTQLKESTELDDKPKDPESKDNNP